MSIHSLKSQLNEHLGTKFNRKNGLELVLTSFLKTLIYKSFILEARRSYLTSVIVTGAIIHKLNEDLSDVALVYKLINNVGLVYTRASLVAQIVKNPTACNVGDLGSVPGLGRSPGGGHGNSLWCSCLENPHRQRSLVGYSLWGCEESETTESLSTM